MKYNIAIVGATGMVGSKFVQVLEEKDFPIENLYLFASSKSKGKVIKFKGDDYIVEELLEENIKNKKIHIALFSAGGSTSLDFAKIFVKYNAVVIDNSSCYRMDKDVPLVVPQVNKEDIKLHKGIIANPNCSTIQAMVALSPLQKNYGIKRIIYSTYQAVSGAGVLGHKDLKDGILGTEPKKFKKPIAFNVLPHIDDFTENGYTKEELKMINETRKILHDDTIKITATTVRVPVYNGHSESINVELNTPFKLDHIFELFKKADGVIVMDDIENEIYPTALDSNGHDEVFVGRIRRDFSTSNGLNLWVVADNIRKGAASNAIEIAEYMINNMLI